MRIAHRVFLPTVVFATSCYSAELDSAADGVFACSIDREQENDGCPPELTCDGQHCLAEVPSLEITAPETRQIFSNPADVQIVFRGGSLNLTPATDGSPGEGFVRVTLDDETVDITEGALSSNIAVNALTIPSEPGGHRISVQAFRPDGTPYDNESALATRLFWIDDGLPHVAITKPWPGQAFRLDTPSVEFEVAALNFVFTPAERPVEDELQPPEGHAHMYYDASFPACAREPACDVGYVAVISPLPGEGESDIVSAVAPLPVSAETSAQLTAVLRKNNHNPVWVDPTGAVLPDSEVLNAPDDAIELVVDEITINRIGGA